MNTIQLTPMQAKFFNVIMQEALKDDDFAEFIIGRATGKSVVMEQAIKSIRSFHQAKDVLDLTDAESSGVKSQISKMIEKGEWKT